MAGGTKYHAHFVPDEDLTADLYETACERLNAAGVCAVRDFQFRAAGTRVAAQSEILDAPALSGIWRGCAFHACRARRRAGEAVRFSSPDSLEEYVAGAPPKKIAVSPAPRSRKPSFWDLRLTRGVDLKKVAADFGEPALRALTARRFRNAWSWDCWNARAMWIRLTARGRLLSNEVFERFIAAVNEFGHSLSRKRSDVGTDFGWRFAAASTNSVSTTSEGQDFRGRIGREARPDSTHCVSLPAVTFPLETRCVLIQDVPRTISRTETHLGFPTERRATAAEEKRARIRRARDRCPTS